MIVDPASGDVGNILIEQRREHADQASLGLPAQAQQGMKLCLESTAFTTCGATVSS